MADLDITGRVVVDASQAEGAFDRVADKAEQMAREVAGAAGQAGKAVDKIGDGAAAGAEKFTREQARIRDAIQRSTLELKLLNKTASEKFEIKLESKGIDAGIFKGYLAELKKAEAAQLSLGAASMRSGSVASASLDSMGMSAKATAAALRGVPAQFTDIIASLQGGQAPLTVFLQQGGQLKDMFGGAGNAAKALGGYVLGMVNPFTIAAAAAVALAVAYKQGTGEADAYARSLALTGNAAGTTGAQLQQMAARISASVGTQGAAADALAQLAGTGKVASQNLEQFAETAVRVERSIGVAVKDTVKDFAELGKSPVEASKKLNESYNYLTAAVFEQIKALQDQGRALEAASVAQKAYDQAMNNATATLEGRLGYIERAWRGVGDAAKSAWDKMLNVGRPDTLATQLESARANLEQKMNTPLAVDNPAMRASRDKGIESLRNEINLLSEQERVMKRGAEAQAARTQAEKDGIAAAEALQKTQDKGLTKQQQMNKALEDYRKQLADLRATNPGSERLTSSSVARGESAIREQFADKGALAAINKEQAAYESLIASIRTKIEEAKQELSGNRALSESQKMRIKLDEELLSGKLKLTGADKARSIAALEELAAQEKLAVAAKEALKVSQDRQSLREKETSGIAAWFAAEEAAAASALASARDRVKSLVDEQQALVLSTTANISLAEAVERVALARLQEKQAGFVDGSEGWKSIQKEIDKRKELMGLVDGKAAREATADAAKKAADDWAKTSEEINRTLTDALMRGFESGKDFAKNMRDTIVNMFKTMVLRPVISAVLSPISGGISGALGGGGAGAGGGGGGVIGMASNAYSLGSNAYGLYSGGFGGTAIGQAYAGYTGATIPASMVGPSMTPVSMYSGIGNSAGSIGSGASGGSSALAAGGAFVAVAALVLNALGAFKSDKQTGSGFQGTLGGTVSPYEEWREGGSLFSGPSSSKFNPLQNLIDQRKELQTLRDQGLGSSGGAITLQRNIDEIEKKYGDLITSAAAQNKVIQDSYDGMRKSAGDMADALGLSSESVRKFTIDLTGDREIELQGLNPAEQQAKFAEALATANNELAQQVLGSWVTTTENVTRVLTEGRDSDSETLRIWEETNAVTTTRYVASEYAKEGEKAIDTLTRLATSLGTVNAIWENLGYTVYEASLAGADAASTLADAFGGLDNMAAVTGAYYENFYSEAEKAANVTRDVTEALADVGLEMPKTREEFRALVEAQMALGDSGTGAVAALLGVSGAFASVTDAAETAAAAAARVEKAKGAGRKDRLAAQRAQEKQAAEALQKQIDAYTEGAQAFTDLSKTLLLAGDAAGLLGAAMKRAFDNPSGKYTAGGREYDNPKWEANSTAASFNYDNEQMQGRIRKDLSEQASADALRVQNVQSLLSEYSVERMLDIYNPVTGGIAKSIQQGIVDASGDVTNAVRDAVQDASLYAAQQSVRQEYTARGPGLNSIAAAQANLADTSQYSTDNATGMYRIGGAAVAYGEALGRLEGALFNGRINAETFDKAVEALAGSLPGAAQALGTLEDRIAAVEGASYQLGTAGLNSINYYFGQLGNIVQEMADAAAKAAEPIALTTAAIGRLSSAQTAFGESAKAALEGFGGGGLAGSQMLGNAGVQSTISRSQLIAESAGIAAGFLTTADAAAAALKIAKSPAFDAMDKLGIRDASLLLDGVGQYNADGFERAFLRISDALAKSTIDEEQYKALFGVARDMFEGVPEETSNLISAMEYLRDAMAGFADGLLIDKAKTTLTAGATLAEMQRQYGQAFSGASTGDTDAIGKYQSLANGLLDKNLYANQAEYNATFGRVYGDARQLESVGVNTLAAQQGGNVVAEIKAMNEQLSKRVEELDKNLTAALAQIAKNTSETSKGVDRMNTVGLPA